VYVGFIAGTSDTYYLVLIDDESRLGSLETAPGYIVVYLAVYVRYSRLVAELGLCRTSLLPV